jgi:hemolysin III
MVYKKDDMDIMISAHDSNEYVNVISHLTGAILSLAGITVLLVLSAKHDKWAHVVCFSIYGATLTLSLFASFVLHYNLMLDKYWRTLGVFDHTAIYLLIAGSYTPFCLLVLKGPLGWSLFGVIWSLAGVFVATKALFFSRISKTLSLTSYLLIGWPAIFFANPIYSKLSLGGLIVLTLSGLFYTGGAIVFNTEKPNPWPPYFGHHEIWHVMVLLGNLAMYIVMLLYVLPYNA